MGGGRAVANKDVKDDNNGGENMGVYSRLIFNFRKFVGASFLLSDGIKRCGNFKKYWMCITARTSTIHGRYILTPWQIMW